MQCPGTIIFRSKAFTDTLPLSVTVGEFADGIRSRTADTEGLDLAVDVTAVLSRCDRHLQEKGWAVADPPQGNARTAG